MNTIAPYIHGITILDTNGEKIVRKYFSKYLKSAEESEALEKNIFNRTKNIVNRSDAEVVVVDSYLVAYKCGNECTVYMIANDTENDLLLISLLESFYDALNTICYGSIDKRSLFDNLKYVLLLIDEIIDNGCILETDLNALVNRTKMTVSTDVPHQQSSVDWGSYVNVAGNIFKSMISGK